MDWMRWTKNQLRLYAARDLYQQDIHNELLEMEDDVKIRTSSLSGMPRAKGGWTSSVEEEAEHREEARKRLLSLLQEFEIKVNDISNALASIPKTERNALEWAYMRANYNSDVEIAKRLKVPLRSFWVLKINALQKVYEFLRGCVLEIDLEEAMSREEYRHQRFMKENKEQQEKRDQIKRMPLWLFFDLEDFHVRKVGNLEFSNTIRKV
jgi:hypothetical protein